MVWLFVCGASRAGRGVGLAVMVLRCVPRACRVRLFPGGGARCRAACVTVWLCRVCYVDMVDAPGGYGRCCYVCWCLPCAAGDVARRVGGGYCIDCCVPCVFPLLAPFIWGYTRTAVRMKYNMKVGKDATTARGVGWDSGVQCVSAVTTPFFFSPPLEPLVPGAGVCVFRRAVATGRTRARSCVALPVSHCVKS